MIIYSSRGISSVQLFGFHKKSSPSCKASLGDEISDVRRQAWHCKDGLLACPYVDRYNTINVL